MPPISHVASLRHAFSNLSGISNGSNSFLSSLSQSQIPQLLHPTASLPLLPRNSQPYGDEKQKSPATKGSSLSVFHPPLCFPFILYQPLKRKKRSDSSKSKCCVE